MYLLPRTDEIGCAERRDVTTDDGFGLFCWLKHRRAHLCFKLQGLFSVAADRICKAFDEFFYE